MNNKFCVILCGSPNSRTAVDSIDWSAGMDKNLDLMSMDGDKQAMYNVAVMDGANEQLAAAKHKVCQIACRARISLYICSDHASHNLHNLAESVAACQRPSHPHGKPNLDVI